MQLGKRWGGLFLGLLWLVLAGAARGEEPAGAPPAGSTAQVEDRGPLAALLDPIVQDPVLGKAVSAVQVVDVETGEEVYAWQAEQALLPASTMKLVTAAAALRTLGPAYRFRTRVLADQRPGGDGVLRGNLYVVGGGDPTLVIEKLWKLVQDLRLEGLREVRGNVVLDASWLQAQSHVPGWDKKVDLQDGPAYFPPLGALSLNFNTVALCVAPGPQVGGPARVELETPSAVVSVDNQVTTVARGHRGWLSIEREVDGRKVRFQLRGAVPEGSAMHRYYRAVPDAAAYFTGALAALFKRSGIRVRGHWVDGTAPEEAEELLVLESPPLATVLAEMNKHSSNFMAEQLLEVLGAEVYGAPGTTEAGLRVLRDYLSSLGLPPERYHLVNGSGLSKEARLSPEVLTALLVDLYHDPQVGAEFRASLAIGGLDGTLRSRFTEPAEVNRVRGKTGSLNGVHCLAGYVETPRGTYAFAYLVNGIPGPLSRARRVQDRFVEALLGAPLAEGGVPGDGSMGHGG